MATRSTKRSKKRSRSRYDPMAAQAQVQGQLRYGSEENALQQLLADAQNDLLTSARIQRGVGQTAQNRISEVRGLLPGMFQGASPQTIQMLQGDLNQRALRATEGEQYALNRASQTYQSDAAKIRARQLALAGERGVFEAATLGDLAGADRKLRHETNLQNKKFEQDLTKLGIQQQFTAGENALNRAADAAKEKAKAKKEAKAKKKPTGWVPPEQQNTAAKEIGLAKAWAERLKRNGYDRRKAAQALQGGLKLPSGQVPAISDEVLLSAGLDVAYDGHISRNNVGRLHVKRIKVKPLGYRTKPRPRPPGVSGTIRVPTS